MPRFASRRTRGRAARATFAVLAIAATAAATAVPAGASPTAEPAQAEALVHVVSGRTMVQGAGDVLGADRTAATLATARNPAAAPSAGADGHAWKAMDPMSGVVKDISFATKKVGYAAAELGVVWKTTNGGKTWTRIVNVGFPLYFYGLDALSASEVVVSGFDNQAGSAVVWRTIDGGTTWDKSISFPQGWGGRIRFSDADHGLLAGLTGSQVWSTQTGGESADDWTFAQPEPVENGWIGAQFTLLASQRAYLTGINFCRSKDGGIGWNCEHSVDPVFDGPAEFVSNKVGWVGGGTISPDVEGWVHRTTDGGKTWSDRTLDGDWPVRHIEAIDNDHVWAVAGDAYSGQGGMYYSSDGGQTWVVDLETGSEMTSCDQRAIHDSAKTRLWCVGYANTGGWVSHVYRLTVATPAS